MPLQSHAQSKQNATSLTWELIKENETGAR